MKHKLSLPTFSGATGEKGWWHETSDFRKLVPQLLVTVINNMLLMDLSMMLAFPTLVIGALYDNPVPDEDGLQLNAEQASWLGSLVYLMQPLGSLVSGLITEPLGRKRGMMFVNIPPLIGWLMLYFAPTVGGLYAANAVLGLSIGFMEAPVLTYVGEISEPRLRSFLTAFTGVMAQTGYLLVYLLGATMPWRPAAAVCASIPVISFLLMLMVPESPLWLLARGREREADASLRWLRGWVRHEAVREELAELTAYAEHTRQITSGPDGKGQSVLQRIRDLFRPQTFRPLVLVILFFLVFHSSGMSGVRPYMVRVIQEFQLPVDPNWATVMTAVLGLLATALLMGVVSRVGKRRLSLASIAGCVVSCAVMGTYAFVIVRPTLTSTTDITTISNSSSVPVVNISMTTTPTENPLGFNITQNPFSSLPTMSVTNPTAVSFNATETSSSPSRPLSSVTTFTDELNSSVSSGNVTEFYTTDVFSTTPEDNSTSVGEHDAVASKYSAELPATWLPFMAFICLSFFTYFGVGQIPWMYVAEVFPLRSRGLASGVTAAAAYVLYFTAAKTYLMLETALTLHGVFWAYAACGVLGFLFLYFQLPETEGKTLEEVEEYFNSKIRNGRKNSKRSADGKTSHEQQLHRINGVPNAVNNGCKEVSNGASKHTTIAETHASDSGYDNNAFHVTHM